MCGIGGYVLRAPVGHDRFVTALLGPLRRRGPDDEGVCAIDRAARASRSYATGATAPALRGSIPLVGGDRPLGPHDAALVHTRYAIIDLSPAGHQPFHGPGGAITAVFNGEIYNYLELRRELQSRGSRFETATDTEVLVEGYRVWGDAVWGRMNGFWAVALYDRRTGEVILARDRLGVAPLYYRETRAGVFFASAIRSLPGDRAGGGGSRLRARLRGDRDEGPGWQHAVSRDPQRAAGDGGSAPAGRRVPG